MVSTVRIGSIQSILQDKEGAVEQKVVKKEEEVEFELSRSQDFKPLLERDAKRILMEYADVLLKEQRRGLAAYLQDPVFKLEGDALKLIVGSKTLLKELEEDMRKLIKAFHLQHFDPKIELILNAQKVEEYKVFTPKQKFDALAKKNPVLKDFENRFGLDFDS